MRSALAFLLSRFLPAGNGAGEAATLLPGAQRVQYLESGATLVLPQAQARVVRCVQGSVWITQDGDCRDVVLSEGESHTGDRATRMLVHGLAPSTIWTG